MDGATGVEVIAHRFAINLAANLPFARIQSRLRNLQRGRESRIPPGVYFQLLLVGSSEELDSERQIAGRCAASPKLRAFLGYELDRTPAGPFEPLLNTHAPEQLVQQPLFRHTEQQAVYHNRRRIRGRTRSSRTAVAANWSNAASRTDSTTAARATSGSKAAERYLIHIAAFSLGLVIRKRIGFSTLRGRAATLRVFRSRCLAAVRHLRLAALQIAARCRLGRSCYAARVAA